MQQNENRDLEIVADEIMNAKHNNARLVEAKNAVDAYFANPSDENEMAVSENASKILELFRMIKDYSDALADLKSRVEYAVANLYDYHPSLRENFKFKAGASKTTCSAKPDSMERLMAAWIAKGYDPAGLFAKCSAITSKKAADAFGLSEQALLEEFGDLFSTTRNKPALQMNM